MFLKEDGNEFNIKETWTYNRNPNEKEKNIESTPVGSHNSSNNMPNNVLSRKGSNKVNDKDVNSILNNAGKLSIKNNSVEDLLDDKLSKNIVKNLMQENNIIRGNTKIKGDQLNKILNDNTPPPVSYANSKKPPLKTDNDLISSMAARLKQLELTCNSQREEIKDKMKTINQLNEELVICKAAANNKEALEEMRNLKEQTIKQKKQIADMEKFLHDYGLKWVGENKEPEGELQIDDIKKELGCAQPLYKNNLPREIDMNVVVRRIDELNITMEKDGSHEVFKDKDGAYKIKKLDPLAIGFYQNGLVIQGFPFYPYQSREAQQILEDILDGYFPLLLKKKYPQGVFFKVVDKVDEVYTALKKNKFGDFASMDEENLKPLSKEEFLKQFPKQYVKNGKIVSVRDEIAKKIENNTSEKDETTQKKNENLVFNDGLLEIESENVKKQKGTAEVTTLKIRADDGKKTIILKLLPSEMMKTVFDMIFLIYPDKNFELISNFQKVNFKRESLETLEELGLHPSAALQMNPIKK